MKHPFPALRLLALCLTLMVFVGCALKPPVTVERRDSAMGQGIVVEITNTSDQFLHEVVVRIESPQGEKKMWSTATISPHDTISVGWLKLDGWPIPEGSKVSVESKGFVMPSGPWTL